MADIHIPDEIPVRYLPRSRGATIILAALFVVGVVAFFLTLSRDPAQAWRAYVVNWLYFTSLAMGAVIVVASAAITKAKWDWSVRRVGLAFAAFLPVSFLLFLPMLGIAESFLPWVEEMAHDPILQNKSAYLNLPFLMTRDVVGLLVLFGVAVYFAYLTLRPDLGLAAGAEGSDEKGRAAWRDRLTTGWLGQEAEEVRSYRKMTRVAPALALLFAGVLSMISYDWIMSLEPHWFSTLFGAWFFMGSFWGGVAVMAVAVVWLKGRDPDFDRMMGVQQLHDLGKLAFAFSIFWAYLFWSQYLVIWYGKLPWEQSWIIQRSGDVWGGLGALVVVLCFVVPFATLIGRAPKMKPRLLGAFSGVILVGLWLERYMMVVPSIHTPDPAAGEATLTIWEPLIGLGFLGLFLASVRWFLSTFPVVQVWQHMVMPEMLEAEMNEDGEFPGRSAAAEVPTAGDHHRGTSGGFRE